jgi:hypothetical protein
MRMKYFIFFLKKIANFGVSYYRISKSYKQLTDLINKYIYNVFGMVHIK